MKRLVVAGFALALNMGAVAAQETAEPEATLEAAPAQEAPAAKSRVLDEIVVTATKRETTVQSTAASISAFSGEQMEHRGLENAQDLAFGVPGLIYGEGSGSPQITIRGIGLSVETGSAEQGVASHLNGVFLTRPGLTNLGLGDLQRVEIVRGPQGTLYGRNATGGAINYITRKPTEDFEAEASAAMGSFGQQKFQGAVSGPLWGEIVTARVFAKYDDNEGYVENLSRVGNGADVRQATDFGIRGTLLVRPTEALKVEAIAGYHKKEGTFVPFQWTNVVGDRLPTDPEIWTTEANKIYNNVNNDNFFDGTLYSLDISYDFGPVLVRSISGYTLHTRDEIDDSDGRNPSPTLQANVGGIADNLLAQLLPPAAGQLPASLTLGADTDFLQDREDDFKAFTQELNLSGTLFDRLDWILGGFYMREWGFSEIDIFIGPNSGGVLAGMEFVGPTKIERNTSMAVFTDLTLSIFDNLRVAAGVRVGMDKKRTHLFDDTIAAIAVLGFGLDGNCAVPDRTFRNTSPKYRVEFDASDDILLYGQYQEAVKPGGTNPNACIQTYEQEKVKAWEGGFKASLLERRLIVNASAFTYDYDNYQVFQILPPASAEIINAPKASVTGAELEVFGVFTDYLAFDAGLSYLDAQYDEFSGVDTVFVVPQPEEDLAGNRLTRAPQYTVNLGVDLTLPIERFYLGTLRLRGEMAYVDEMFFRQFNRDFDRQEAYSVFNVIMSLSLLEERAQLRAFVKNLTDTEYVVSQFSNANEFSLVPDAQGRRASLLGLFGAPRQIGIELKGYF